jgi:hypothetical protein
MQRSLLLSTLSFVLISTFTPTAFAQHGRARGRGHGQVVVHAPRPPAIVVVAPRVVRAPRGRVIVRVAPPAPPVLVAPPPPAPAAVWVEGYWTWNGNAHDWVEGHWEAPRAGRRFRQARWQARRGGWVLVPGGWIRVR